jgi:UDP-N-acetylmuramate dehydrogenase
MIIRHDEPLSLHTTYRIGGACHTMLFPEEQKDFAALPKLIGDKPCFVMGGGANILFADDFFDAVFINLSAWTGIGDVGTGSRASLTIRSGTRTSDVVDYARTHQLAGYDFLAGIPGTIGGAAFMNAGAWGRALAPLVRSIEMYNLPKRKLSTIEGEQLSYGYRSQSFITPGDVVTIVELTASERDEQIDAKITEIMRLRREKQPPQPSCGSVFRNPKDQPAGRLIEACGLKGKRQGMAQISEQHANFIINLGGAAFADVYGLITLIQTEVKKKHGVGLEPEVRIITSVDHPLFFRL